MVMRPEEDLGRQVFGALGVEVEGGRGAGGGGDEDQLPPDFGWGPEPRGPTETWAGVERRRLLSDWVRKGDPRSLGPRDWDPEEGYLLEFYKGGEGDDGEDGDGIEGETGFGGSRGAQNLDGLFDMDSMHEPEMRHALSYGSGPLGTAGGRYHDDFGDVKNPGYGPQPGPQHQNQPEPPDQIQDPLGWPHLPREAVRELARRFRAAEARAISIEKRASGGVAALMPSASAHRWSSNATRIARVFDPGMRINDADRAMQFYTSHPDALDALRKLVTVSSQTGRRQFGTHRPPVWPSSESKERVLTHDVSQATMHET